MAESSNHSIWPFNEAQRLLDRLKKQSETVRDVVFETGYGPSGLPHIGTFGEVVRTSMVRHAFSVLAPDRPCRLICFSDDMDGLRKVPGNVPQQDMLREHLNKPLMDIPDPFGKYESFGAHNNARLRKFLDRFGFEYEFASATEHYRSGRFDETLLKALAAYDDIMAIILPALGEERRRTYSPFLPVCSETGTVLMAQVVVQDSQAGTITYVHPDHGREVETPVTGGHCKLQWKADWAMRWVALGVDYEMSGKDLMDSVRQSSQICRALKGTPPEGFSYELFLDKNGSKISKSIGNGLTIEEWLRYAPPESLSLFMYQNPRRAKRLYFDVIPKTVDNYISHLNAFPNQTPDEQQANPVWHIHSGKPPLTSCPVNYSLLLSLAAASRAQDKAMLWGFIRHYKPDATPETYPLLDDLAGHAIIYAQDFITLHYTAPHDYDGGTQALESLKEHLIALPELPDADTIQTLLFELGKEVYGKPRLREWFGFLYQTLLGSSAGARFGTFIALYGVENTVTLIDRALSGELIQNNQVP
ncbi:MAG: lysine--tRNA ligase [Parvularculales bacterium]